MSRRQELLKINFPNALPHFFAGARIGATWSVIGSIVLEFTGNGIQGLGYLMLNLSYYGEGAQAAEGGDPEYFLWAVAVGSAVVGLVVYASVVIVEWLVTRDRRPPELT
jgi:ABC-type nitrate/sulfonate/bicarbonate transport system permease component